MVIGVNFADKRMIISQDLCRRSSLKNGVDEFFMYSDNDVSNDFKNNNKDVWGCERGFSFWIWKPYVIQKAINNCGDNDILIYFDSGIEVVNDVQNIINLMTDDIFFFTNGWPHVEWCKGDVWRTIYNPDTFDMNMYTSIKQIQASVIFFRVNQKTRDFVKEWLLYCQMPGFIDDSPSKLPNYPTFAEHRHDQAILTCLAIKHGYTMDHWWPTQYSMHLPRSERDSYPVMFNHHRKRNEEW